VLRRDIEPRTGSRRDAHGRVGLADRLTAPAGVVSRRNVLVRPEPVPIRLRQIAKRSVEVAGLLVAVCWIISHRLRDPLGEDLRDVRRQIT
jgi:hypothetical protein